MGGMGSNLRIEIRWCLEFQPGPALLLLCAIEKLQAEAPHVIATRDLGAHKTSLSRPIDVRVELRLVRQGGSVKFTWGRAAHAQLHEGLVCM